MHKKLTFLPSFALFTGLLVVSLAEASNAQVCTPGQKMVDEVRNDARTGDGPIFGDGEPIARQVTFTAPPGYMITSQEFIQQGAWGKTSWRIDKFGANTNLVTASSVESVKRELVDYIGGKVSILDKIKIDARQRLEQSSNQYLALAKQASTSNAAVQLTLEAIPRSKKRTSAIWGVLKVNLQCVGFTNQSDLRLSLRREVDQILAKGVVPTPAPVPTPVPVQVTCVSVDSRRGWQSFTLSHPTHNIQASGTWRFNSGSPIDAGGYNNSNSGTLAGTPSGKYDERFPLGALLISSPVTGVSAFRGSFFRYG